MKKLADLLVNILSFEVILMVMSRVLYYTGNCSFEYSNSVINIVFIIFGVTGALLVLLLLVHHFTDKSNKY